MKKHSEESNWEILRQEVIGLGERSVRKNSYTELKNRLDDLERFRFLLDCTVDSIFVVEIPTGRIIDINKSVITLFGYSKDQILSMNIKEVFEEDLCEKIINIPENEKSKDQYQEIVLTKVKSKIRESFPVEISINSAKFFSKIYAIILVRDITERKKQEEELKRFKFILDHSGEEFYLFNPDGSFAYVNEAVAKSLQYSIEELLEMKIFQINGNVNQKSFLKHFEFLKENDIPPYEIMQTTKFGNLIPKEIKSVYLKIGEKEYICSFARDITLRKKSEEELRKLSRAVQQSSSLIIITDLLGKVEYINPKYSNATGFMLEEINGEIPKFLSYDNKNPERFKNLWSTILAGREWKEELKVAKKDGDSIWIQASISPVQNDLGKITHLLCTAEDVTDQKIAEEELIRAKDKAERSDRLKTEFLAQMSHEIRTPVNTILNYISLVKEELQANISEDLKVSFKAIDNGSRRLIKTIDSLINMSQIQTGNYDYNPARINLEKDIIENVILDYLYLVKGKNVDLKFINKAESPVISGDIYSITQIFVNLIDNAVKYTNDGKIDVVLYNCEDSLCVDVSDTGIGISDEYMGRLFQPFSQEDTGYRRRFDGNGLGLALVLKYAELNNAEIKVKSEKGKGSTFTVKFNSK